MATLLVSHDLHKPVRNYHPLLERLEQFPGRGHCLESTWIIPETNHNAGSLRDELGMLIDQDDSLMVVDVTRKGWGTKGMSNACNAWLKRNVSMSAS